MRLINVRVVMVLFVCSCASTQQPPAASSAVGAGATVAGVSKSFTLVGDDGVVVDVVDFEDGQALLRISGVESPLQNKVLAQQRGRDGQDLRYTMPWGGRERLTLLHSGDNAWVGTYWQLYVPGSEAVPVMYSEDRSAKLDVDKLVAAHKQQRDSGELERIQRFDQGGERGREDEAVTRSASAASRECGTTLAAAIEWKTVSDQALREHNVSDYCSSALHALMSACGASPDAKSFVQKQVKSVSCHFDGGGGGGGGEMSLDAGRLTWSMNFELGDLETTAGRAFARIYLPGDEPEASNSTSAVKH